MSVLKKMIPALFLILCLSLPVQAADLRDGEMRSVTGLYEGNSHDEGLVVQIYDGSERYYIHVSDGLTPPALAGKIGSTVRIDYRVEKLDEDTAERIYGEKDIFMFMLHKVGIVSGREDPELCKVRTAAEASDGKACNTLGVWYEKGKHGLPKDPAEAVHWYLMAAAAENTLAMHNMGDCYRDGIGVEKDEKQAVEWYNKAIKAGNPIGYEDLGNLYLRHGRRDEARAMYRKAADAGRASAKKKLAEMGSAGDR